MWVEYAELKADAIDVPEGHTLVALLVLHLLVEGQPHGFRAHLEHPIDLRVDAVVLQAECGVSVWAAAELTAAP